MKILFMYQNLIINFFKQKLCIQWTFSIDLPISQDISEIQNDMELYFKDEIRKREFIVYFKK